MRTCSGHRGRGFAVFLALSLYGCAPTLAGRLTGPAGEPVTALEARVNITSLDPSAPTTVTTVGSDGKFATSEELPPGAYLVEALVPGYTLVSQRIKLPAGEPVELTLKPLPPAKTDVLHINTSLDEGRGAGSAVLTPPSL